MLNVTNVNSPLFFLKLGPQLATNSKQKTKEANGNHINVSFLKRGAMVTGKGGPPHLRIGKENTAISKSFTKRRKGNLCFSYCIHCLRGIVLLLSASLNIYLKGTISVHVFE